MILYYFPIAQNTVNKTVSDFFRGVCAFICLRTYLNIFLFTGLIPAYLRGYDKRSKTLKMFRISQ